MRHWVKQSSLNVTCKRVPLPKSRGSKDENEQELVREIEFLLPSSRSNHFQKVHNMRVSTMVFVFNVSKCRTTKPSGVGRTSWKRVNHEIIPSLWSFPVRSKREDNRAWPCNRLFLSAPIRICHSTAYYMCNTVCNRKEDGNTGLWIHGFTTPEIRLVLRFGKLSRELV